MGDDTLTGHGSSGGSASQGERDLSGATLGGCKLIRKMAEGGMGEIYEATQTKLARKVALKIITAQLSAKPEFLTRFEREAKLAASLNHPNIVQVYDFGEASGLHYLVMEYVEGENLTEHIDRVGKLPLDKALSIIEQAATALKAAGEKSIIHRDIKPSNLMLIRDGRVKVSDLGLAKTVSEVSDVTHTGVGIGSPHYLAPEQADDARNVDHRADIYALGITLMFLLTARRPYDGLTPFSVVLAHANKPLPSGAALGTELPEEVEQLLQRMAAKKPADRYQTYDALIADLQRVRAGRAPTNGVVNKKNPALLVAAAAVIVVLIGVIWFTLAQGARQKLAAVPPAANAPKSNAPPPTPAPGSTKQQTGFDGPPGGGPGGPGGGGFGGPGGGKKGKGQFGPGGGGPGGGERLYPLPPMSEPERYSLAEGPVDKMLAEADAYAAKNPNNFRGIIDRYNQVSEQASGTPQSDAVFQKLRTAIQNHMRVSRQYLNQYTERSQALVKQGKNQEAFEVWIDFPAQIWTREVDMEITQILQKTLPQGFNPQPPRGGPGGQGQRPPPPRN
jgi:predicted Ser/Thr protein kinase